MVKNLIDFYKDLLEVFDIKTDNNGKLFIESDKRGKLMVELDGKPLVLPTTENIRASVEIDNNGKPVQVLALFNPVDESAIKGENKSLLRLREIMERKINNSFAVMGEVLFTILADKKDIEDPNLITFIQELNKYKAPGIKHLVDESTVKNWVDIYKAIFGLETNKLYIHTFLKRGGKIGDKKYTRVATVTFPVYEGLNNLKKNETFYNVKIRNKDKHAYMVFHQYVFNKTHEEILSGIQLGTENKKSPAFIILLTAYELIKNNINSMIDIIKAQGYDVDYLESAKLKDLPIDIKSLEEFIEQVWYEVKEIPSDNELMFSAQTSTTVEPTITNETPQQQQTINNTQQVEEDEDPINKILNNIGSPMPNPMGGILPQQQMMPPMQQQPMMPNYQQTIQPMQPQMVNPGIGLPPMQQQFTQQQTNPPQGMNPGMNMGFQYPFGY